MTARKPAGERRNRNPQRPEPKSSEPIVGPAPSADWSAETVKWWQEWRAAWLLDGVGWFQLRQLAVLLDSYWSEPSASAMGEIRRGQDELRRRATPRASARTAPSKAVAPVRRLKAFDPEAADE